MNKLARLAPMAFLVACATATAEPRTKSPMNATVEPSAEVTPPTSRGGSVLFLLAAIYDWPEGAEGRQILEINVDRRDGEPYQATIIRSGLLDDSIASIKDVLTLGNDGEWYVVRAEQYRKCYRTGMSEWTARSCP